MSPPKNTTKKPVRVSAVVRLRAWDTIADAVETGIEFGVMRWQKYQPEAEKPEALEALKEHVLREVMNAIDEKIDFGDGDVNA